MYAVALPPLDDFVEHADLPSTWYPYELLLTARFDAVSGARSGELVVSGYEDPDGRQPTLSPVDPSIELTLLTWE